MKLTQFTSTQQWNMVEVPARKMGAFMENGTTLELGKVMNDHPVIGFGVAVTGSSCWNLNLMTAEERADFLKKVYGRDGMRLNVARLSVGSSDYSPEVYSYDDVADDTGLEHFSVARDEEYIFPMVREVLAASGDGLYLFASPWSPPFWMKTGSSIAGGCMRDKFVEVYARYFVKYLKACEEHGVHVSAVTPQNEPNTDTHGLYSGCRWHPETEMAFVHALRYELEKEGMDTGIWLFDHCFNDWGRVMWQLEEDSQLAKDLTGIAFHYYEQNIERIQPILEKFPELPIHFTEAGPRLYDHYDSDHCKWGTMISRSFNNGCRSFTGWNLMLDETGGPNVGPFFCGGFATRDVQTGELSWSGQAKAMAHFSKFVDRGAKVLESRVLCEGFKIHKYPDVEWPTEVCAFENPDGTVVLILVNPDKGRKQIQLHLGDEWYYLPLAPDSVSTVLIGR